MQSSEQRGLKLNTSKTKLMVVTKGYDDIWMNISVGGETLVKVGKYKYLGNIVTQDGIC